MMKPGCESVMPNSDSTNRASVRMADRYTMSITGFFACSRGASFTKAVAHGALRQMVHFDCSS